MKEVKASWACLTHQGGDCETWLGQQASCERHKVIRKSETNDYLRSHGIKNIKWKKAEIV